jgi:PAS domain S-box-containing protein
LSPDGPSGPGRSPVPYYAIALAIALLFGLVSAYVVWQIQAEDYETNGRSALNTATLLADSVEDEFDQLDALTKSIARLYVDSRDSGPEESARLVEYMRKEIAEHPFVARISVADANGQVVLGSGPPPLTSNASNVSDRTYFQRAAAGDRGEIFDGPIKSKYSDEWVTVLARRMEDAGGRFIGVVTGSIPVESIEKLFSTLDFLEHGAVDLWTDDGALVAPEPRASLEVGVPRLFETAKAFLRGHPEQDHSLFETVSPFDGVARLYALQRLPHAPFLLTVGQPKADLDQPWRRLATELGVLCLVVTIAALWTARRLHTSAVQLGEDNRLLESRVAERTAEIEAKNQALIASERTFSDAMACAPNPMCLIAADGRFIAVNAALCDQLGYTRDELLSLDVPSIVAPEDGPFSFENLQRLTAGELKTIRNVRRYLHKDGRRIPLQMDVSLARTASGEFRYFIAQGQDVSARLAYEERLTALNARLTERVESEVQARQSAQARLAQGEKMAALGQLAGGVAHDFNNVLQTVLMSAAIVQRSPEDAGRVRAVAAMIEEAATRGAAITGRLLAFARRNDLSREAVDIASVLSELAPMLKSTLAPGIRLVVDTAPDLPEASTDRHQLETALVNLATNAADAIVGDGLISFSARKESVGDGDVHELERGLYVRIDVRDDGTGMDEHTQLHMFEPFFTTKDVGKGTGLGLSTARSFAEQSGGGLRITSRLGEGTTASLWLPVAARGEASASSAAPSDPVAGKPLSVLIVDDEQPLREMLALDLKDRGFAVDAAGSGAEALARLDAGARYDVVVSDLAMPNMNGVMFLNEARRRVADLPAIILTGNTGAVTMQSLEKSLGVSVIVIRKPVAGAALAAAIVGLTRTPRDVPAVGAEADSITASVE